MAYLVREMFRTLQGEGVQVGTPMLFVRFSGCNLWTGREPDRVRDAARTGAQCPLYCDTDFVSGERLEASDIVARLSSLPGPRWICFTGGEPALQLDRPLLEATRAAGYLAAIETNGSRDLGPIRDLLDWVCVSPKLPLSNLLVPSTAQTIVCEGDELKLIYQGQAASTLEPFVQLHFRHFLLQPAWGPRYQEFLVAALSLVQAQPVWRLSLQTHKILGLP